MKVMKDQIENKYMKAIQFVCECGNIINDTNAIDGFHKNVLLDLLFRIKRNCNSLMKLSNLEDDYLAIRLLQRSIIGDLITVFFFVSLLDDSAKFIEAVEILDNLSEKSIKEWLKIHWVIDKTNANNRGEDYVSEEEYLESFNSYVQQYHIGSSNKQFNASKSTSLNFSGTLSSMKSCTEKQELGKPIKYLYTEYRFLSQIEHYSPLNRGFSYVSSKDETIKIHSEVIEYCLGCMLGEIKNRFNK